MEETILGTANQSNNANDDVRKTYEAIVNYHNILVQIRFYVATIFVAAASFLVSSAISSGSSLWFNKNAVPFLGLIVTVAVWIMEVRTYHLLRNLCETGLEIERMFDMGKAQCFFSLMNGTQNVPIRMPLFRININGNKYIRYIFSHSFGLDCLYLSFLIFWVYLICKRLTMTVYL